MAAAPDAEVHGLAYPPGFLDALPVLVPRPAPHAPVRALTAAQFAQVHLAHTTAHAPDAAIFPFLHGLEGDNAAQNAFFAAPGARGAAHPAPRFRGLVWAAADADEAQAWAREGDPDSEMDDLESDDAFSESSFGESVGPMDMDQELALDPVLAGPDVAPHMHPTVKKTADPAAPPLLAQLANPRPAAGAKAPPTVLTSTFRVRELVATRLDKDGQLVHEFVEPKVPDGISLRNFGIQVPIYATISDVVVYSPTGNVKQAQVVAERFAHAIAAKRAARTARTGEDPGVAYNVFVVDSAPEELAAAMPHAVVRMVDARKAHTDGTDGGAHGDAPGEHAARAPNTVDFARREKEEMRDLTAASEIVSVAAAGPAAFDEAAISGSSTARSWEPRLGQVFLGNSADVPLPPDRRLRVRHAASEDEDADEDADWRGANAPADGRGYDLCIECHDFAPFPGASHLRAAEEHIAMLERRWIAKCLAEKDEDAMEDDEDCAIPARPPPGAPAVVHLPFPSSPPSSPTTLATLLPFIAFIERLLQPPTPVSRAQARQQLHAVLPPQLTVQTAVPPAFGPSSLPPPSAFPKSFFPGKEGEPGPYTRMRSTSATFSSSPTPSSPGTASAPSTPATSRHPSAAPLRTRPAKILIYSADGYTESSVLALCLLMALRALSLPEAYLALQVEKRRSFFVYPGDLGVLRRVEQRLEKERAARARVQEPRRFDAAGAVEFAQQSVDVPARPASRSVSFVDAAVSASAPTSSPLAEAHSMSRANSASEADSLVESVPPQTHWGRPRASTLPMPMVPSAGDHHLWFDDPRFEGSFPSRVLPFLYLGNLNHASNAFMLHALGITHVVSVGECALVPPAELAGAAGPVCVPGGAQFVPGTGPGGQGSLWIEEREGRIKVLDIKGVCDDGIDTLEPQLAPICEWIDRARVEGGKVLVHCRVGVSRSATVTIAYVMKHLDMSLVDAYLVVRSRRLSVLIQPNMRLLYNLLGWEVQLARERAGGDEGRLKAELARALNWPYLAREVHALNEKYLR